MLGLVRQRQTGGRSVISHRAISWFSRTDDATMDPVTDRISLRLDPDAARALAVLTRDGTPVSTAVRSALLDAARTRAWIKLRAEAEALAADEMDRAEAAQVLRDMETLRAW